MGSGVLLAWMLLELLVAGSAAQQDPPPTDRNPFFDLEDLTPEPLETLPFELHLRFDLTYGHFEDDDNVDQFDEDFLNTLNTALELRWEPYHGLELLAEVELDGIDGELELDQLLLELETERIGGHVALGVTYVPFGIERRFYSSITNPLVDRPSPFRRIFPGSYSDFGLFVHGSRISDAGSGFEVEAAVTRGLRGPERDDRPDDLFDEDDHLQMVGRVGVQAMPGLRLGTSGLLVWIEDEADQHRRLDLVGIDLLWRGEFSHLRAEYVAGGFEASPAEGGDLRREGWYLELYRRFPVDRRWVEAIEVVGRFDRLDDDDRVRDSRDVDRWAFGVNWVITDQLRLKSQVEFNDEHYDEISNDGFFLQLEGHF